MEGTLLHRVSAIRDQGVCRDGGLKSSAHVSFTVGNATKMLCVIYCISKQFWNPASIVHLFRAFVGSTLELCSAAWNVLSKTQATQTEGVQKKFIRIVSDRHFQRRLTIIFFLAKFLGSLQNRRLVTYGVLLYADLIRKVWFLKPNFFNEL